MLAADETIKFWVMFNVIGAFSILLPTPDMAWILKRFRRRKTYLWRKIDPQAPRCSTIIGLRKKVRIYK